MTPQLRQPKVESRDWTAYEVVLFLGVIPASIEKAPEPASKSEVRRWLENSAVVINGKKPKPMDLVEFPITQLVFFPKSDKRRTTVI